MLLSSFRRWINTRTFSFPRDSQRKTKYDKRRIRLRLEVLEDRCLPSGYNFTTLDVPGSTFSTARGINASRQVVGTYDNAHGFLLSGGSYTTLDVAGYTYALGSTTPARSSVLTKIQAAPMATYGAAAVTRRSTYPALPRPQPLESTAPAKSWEKRITVECRTASC